MKCLSPKNTLRVALVNRVAAKSNTLELNGDQFLQVHLHHVFILLSQFKFVGELSLYELSTLQLLSMTHIMRTWITLWSIAV